MPPNNSEFSHFFALASKSGWIKKIKVLYCVKYHQISIFVLPLFRQRFRNFKKLRQKKKNEKKKSLFFGYEKTRLFAFDIYWPLVNKFWLNIRRTPYFEVYHKWIEFSSRKLYYWNGPWQLTLWYRCILYDLTFYMYLDYIYLSRLEEIHT